jgi:TM2 domain-containing membrane protein YozV
MKKEIIIIILLFFLSALLFGADTKIPDAPGENTVVTSCGWVMFGMDAVLTGLAVWTCLDYDKAARDYEVLRSAIDNLDDINYYRLLYEKEKVDSRKSYLIIASLAAGAALFYTAFDYFFLHEIFPVEIKTGFDPINNEIKFLI